MKAKHSVKLFLEMLKEATLEVQDNEPSNEFRHGVNETIAMAKVWFEGNKVKDIEIEIEE